MKFRVKRASDYHGKKSTTIELNTIDDLLFFCEEAMKIELDSSWFASHPYGVIICKDDSGNWALEIYDDYIE